MKPETSGSFQFAQEMVNLLLTFLPIFILYIWLGALGYK